MKIKIGVSACVLGRACNFNGKDLLSNFILRLPELADIEFVPFCPEDSIFGTPRPNLRIIDGDGDDVLRGNARVVDESGKDVTPQMLLGARNFLTALQSADVKHAILMEGSPSCGSNLILNEENWPRGGFKRGIGVSCALLRQNDIQVLSSFDERSICDFLKSIDPRFGPEGTHIDLREMSKFRPLFES